MLPHQEIEEEKTSLKEFLGDLNNSDHLEEKVAYIQKAITFYFDELTKSE